MKRLLREFKVASEHRFAAKAGLFDDSVDMKEEVWIPLREVGEIPFWHRSQCPFYILRKVLVMVLLRKWTGRQQWTEGMYENAIRTLFRRALSKSWTDFPSYFLNLPRFSMNTLSRREYQSLPTTVTDPFSSSTSLGSLGSRHMISNLSDASCKKLSRRPGSQKNGCNKIFAVSGLENQESGAGSNLKRNAHTAQQLLGTTFAL